MTSWLTAVDLIGAGLATLVANTQVVIVPLVTWLALGEKPHPTALGAMPVVLVGLALTTGLGRSDTYGTTPVIGVGLAVLAAVFYSGLPHRLPTGEPGPRPPGRASPRRHHRGDRRLRRHRHRHGPSRPRMGVAGTRLAPRLGARQPGDRMARHRLRPPPTPRHAHLVRHPPPADPHHPLGSGSSSRSGRRSSSGQEWCSSSPRSPPSPSAQDDSEGSRDPVRADRAGGDEAPTPEGDDARIRHGGDSRWWKPVARPEGRCRATGPHL